MLFPIGIQTFAEIRENGFVYVDKTDLIYQLARTGKYYFLSRPRRFGKSLLVSTLKAYFEEKKELFKGLAIDKLETKWQKYPVLHLDFNGKNFLDEATLISKIKLELDAWEQILQLQRNYDAVDERFQDIIRQLYAKTGKQVVVLIDEYDKPLLDVVDNEEITDKFRGILRGFYSVLKASDEYLRFVFLTGVTKFSQVSIFSGLNQLKDITFNPAYAGLCGITETELTDIFPEQLAKLADEYKVSVPEIIERLKIQFDGYRFSTNELTVYNPFSLLNTLDSSTIDNYWFSTGTPTYLMQLMAKKDINIEEIISKEYDKSQFADYIGDTPQPVPMLYQSGYLTIKKVSLVRFEYRFKLDFPNVEVRRAFLIALSVKHFNIDAVEVTTLGHDLYNMLETRRIDEFLKRMKSFLASVPYNAHTSIKKQRTPELYFTHSFYLILRMIAPQNSIVKVESCQAMGRPDCIYETPDYVFIFEFKQDQSTDKAMQQIEAKNYAAPYANDKRKIYKIAVNFSSQTRTIEEWRIEEGK